MVNFAVPANHRVKVKETEKKNQYLHFAEKFKNVWNMKMTVIPIVICALATVIERVIKELEYLEIRWRVETIQNTIQ